MADPRDFCEANGKEKLPTPQAAATVARNNTRRGKPTSAYRCEHCNWWHVGGGHKPAKINRRQSLHTRRTLRSGKPKF